MPEIPLATHIALDPLWSIRRRPTIAHTPPIVPDFAFVHPACGIALVDVAPNATPRAVEQLHATLLAERFHKSYPAPLPLVYARITFADLDDLGAALLTAFADDPTPAPPSNPAWTRLALLILGGAPIKPPDAAPQPSPDRPPHRWPTRLARPHTLPTLALLALALPLSMRGSGTDPAPPKPQPAFVSALLRCGDIAWVAHDISGAQGCYERAADAGSGIGAVMVGRTYDAAFVGEGADPVLARIWYDRARAIGGDGVAVLLRTER